ncbi:Beta-tubulin_2 [Hexamita inflata]|uniref:Beta-tubulin 2 n=1 Tax=Hexamita inflata TaxID=28002 RepID=A0AA86Q5S3_9EUKA|nr:Beta-tubulin 2 [Hexamita inflata]
MHEIVTISIGECGINIGAQFWRDLCIQSDLSASGHSLDPIFSPPFHLFEEQLSSRFVPRTILLDSQPSALDNIRSTDLGFLFPPNAFISGNDGTGSAFGVGCYDLDLIQEPLQNQIRVQAEKCNQTPNFNIFHSLGGGTGSGTTSFVLMHLSDEYQTSVFNCSVLPEPDACVVSPYNCILGFNYLIQCSNAVQCIDNGNLMGQIKGVREINQYISSQLIDMFKTEKQWIPKYDKNAEYDQRHFYHSEAMWKGENVTSCPFSDTGAKVIHEIEFGSTTLYNSAEVARSIQQQLDRFDLMYKRRAYVYGHSRCMDECEYVEASERVHELLEIYENNGKNTLTTD